MNILHVGATGLVGRLVLARLLASPLVTRVTAPTRRALDMQHPRLHNPVVDFEALPEDAPWWGANAVICTLGTTMAAAGSQAAFRRVDHDYPLRVAQLARRHGAQTYALNSAMGAHARSAIFYNRVKGELEDALMALDFRSLVLVRPGLIDGERAQPRAGGVATAAPAATDEVAAQPRDTNRGRIGGCRVASTARLQRGGRQHAGLKARGTERRGPRNFARKKA